MKQVDERTDTRLEVGDVIEQRLDELGEFCAVLPEQLRRGLKVLLLKLRQVQQESWVTLGGPADHIEEQIRDLSRR